MICIFGELTTSKLFIYPNEYQMNHLSYPNSDFLRGNNISECLELNFGILASRRGSQWRVVVALDSQTSVRFWRSAPYFRPHLGSVFGPPNYRFTFSWPVAYTRVITRLSCIDLTVVFFQKIFTFFHQQGP